MKKLVNDICNELGIAVERAMCEWSDWAKIEYRIPSGVIEVSIDHNDDMSVAVRHNNGVIREHKALVSAIEGNMCGWCELRECFC